MFWLRQTLKQIGGRKNLFLYFVIIVIDLRRFIDKSRLDVIENGCIAYNESVLSSFPISDNETFAFDITEWRGVALLPFVPEIVTLLGYVYIAI